MKTAKFLFFLLFFPQLVLADQPNSDSSLIDRQSQEIIDTTMSPFCPGRTISACPSPDAKKLRDQIHDWFEQGYSATAVKNQLRTLYGDSVLGVPNTKGFDLLAWLSPVLFTGLGLCLIYLLLYRAKTSKTPKVKELSVDTEFVKELEDEVKKRLEGRE